MCGVSQYFSFGRSRDRRSSWFRLGRLDVTTILLFTLLAVVGLFLDAFTGGRSTSLLGLDPVLLGHGQVWRLVTWPFVANLSLFGVIALFFLWYFGTRLEEDLLGRLRMAWLLGGMVVLLGLVAFGMGQLLAYGSGLAGAGLIEIMVLLLFIAEYPHVRFFFNIPAWVLGVVLMGLQVLQYVQYRDWLGLSSLLIGLVLVAVLARSLGMLAQYSWIPRVPVPHRPRQPRARRPKPARGRRRGSASVTPIRRSDVRRSEAPSTDQEALDALLDKISAGGMESLSESEKKQLLVLRDRLRNR